MNLLITNDDGYSSRGIRVLAERLAAENNVFILAPESNRSAVSNHLTMFRENTFTKISDNVFSCSGYPADCTFAGVAGNLFNVKIDAVVAGINYGANLGTDIIYSGTCAAVRQAVLQKIPGIAVSLDLQNHKYTSEEEIKFEPIADFVAKNLEKLVSLSRIDFPRTFVNVNGAAIEKYKGVVFTNKLCQRNYNDKIMFNKKSDNIYESEFVFGENITEVGDKSDFDICHNGYISVTSVYADPVGFEFIDGISFSV